MKTTIISKEFAPVSRVGIGCMRIAGMEKQDVAALIDEALDLDINFFDHADIYGGGSCEELFGEVLTPARRERMVLQSKCAIRPGICFDFSKDYILNSVDGILKRLQTDHLDILLLHRPDALMEADEVAEAFNTLKIAGKVTAFGVSNCNPFQIELLNKYCNNAILVDQIQFSIAHCPTIDAGLNFNIESNLSCMKDGGILEYCQLKGITPQAWSPFQYGMFKGTFIGNELFPELNNVLNRLAEKYDTTPNGIAVAWILRHPAQIQTIIGTANKARFAGIAKAADIRLTREEWYELYMATGKVLP